MTYSVLQIWGLFFFFNALKALQYCETFSHLGLNFELLVFYFHNKDMLSCL